MSNLLTFITNLIISVISTLGYPGIALLMAIQTMAIPMPSEVIIPFAGFLAATGRFSIFLIALVGAFGSVVGSSVSYAIGYKGGRALVQKYGKYILISVHDLEITENFFSKFGGLSAFIGQLLPVVRSFIGFPAGIAKMKYLKFIFYTFAGSFIWCFALAFIGSKLGENWDTLRTKFHKFDVLIVSLIVLGAGFWIYRHVNQSKK